MANERKRRVQLGARLTVVALLLGWVVVVVVGGGSEPTDDPLLGVDNVGWVLVGGMLLLALAGLILLVYLKPQRGPQARPQRQRQTKFFWVILFALFMLWRPEDLWEVFNDNDEESSDAPEEAVGEAVADQGAAESVAQATDVFLVVLVIAVLAGLLLYVRYRLAPPLPVEEQEPEADLDIDLEADLLAAIDDAAIELTSSDDPRTAVLRAYASLEQVLASRDSKRAASETPTEHLRRALGKLRVDPAPLIQLGSLYELARFSGQTITTDQQHQAGVALQRSRDELAALT